MADSSFSCLYGSIRREPANSLIRRYPSPQVLRSRPHCDVCGWTEVSLCPETVIAHCNCHAAFRNFSVVARSLGEVVAHRSCMLTVLPISQGRYLMIVYSVVKVKSSHYSKDFLLQKLPLFPIVFVKEQESNLRHPSTKGK